MLLDPEFTPKLRSIAVARLKRVTDGAAEPAFKEQMQLAISIGYLFILLFVLYYLFIICFVSVLSFLFFFIVL